MLIKEYRIPLPFTVEEYKIAQLYMVDKKSRIESHGGSDDSRSGVEILENSPYSGGFGGEGQYTRKVFHLGQKLPSWLRSILPKTAQMTIEEAWNAYPLCKTKFTCPFLDKFFIEVETRFYDNDRGEQENVFELTPAERELTSVDLIDIVADEVDPKEYDAETDPSLFASKTGRGPLKPGWIKRSQPIMCAYKLCKVHFKWWGLQSKIERFCHRTALRKTMLIAHRQAWCWQDEFMHLTMSDIRRMEAETMKRLMSVMHSDEAADAVAGEVQSPPQDFVSRARRRSSAIARRASQDRDLMGSLASLESLGVGSDGEGEEFFDAYDTLSLRSFQSQVSDHRGDNAGSGSEGEGEGSGDSLDSFEEHVLIVVHSHCILGPSEIDDPGDDVRIFQRTLSQITSTRHWHVIPVFHAGVTDDAMDLMNKLRVRHHPSSCPLDAIALASFGGKRYLSHLRECMSNVNAAFVEFQQSHPDFDGKIHVVGDSVGSVLMYDALTLDGLMGFSVSNFFALGSPLGLLLAHRQQTHVSADQAVLPPQCESFFNLFVTGDPVAYKAGPLLSLDSVDFELTGPYGLYTLAVDGLVRLAHASYWENRDAAAFLATAISGTSHTLGTGLVPFDLVLPRRTWRKRSPKYQLWQEPNHRMEDCVVQAGKPQVLQAKFAYGSLSLVHVTGEDVAVCLLVQGKWKHFATVQTGKGGKVQYEIPRGRQLPPGTYAVKMVLLVDNHSAMGWLLVTRQDRPTKAVVFSLVGALGNRKFNAKGMRLRPGAVDVTRWWNEQGSLLVYVTGRPDMQKNDVLTWLKRHNFPFGVTRFATGLMSRGDATTQKRDFLLDLKENQNVEFVAGYGSGNELDLFKDVEVNPKNIYMVDKKQPSDMTFQSLTQGYSDHLAMLKKTMGPSSSGRQLSFTDMLTHEAERRQTPAREKEVSKQTVAREKEKGPKATRL